MAAIVFGAALVLAGVFDFIARGAYDFDEFVYLLLGHAIASGRVPYRDFLFYHPPGIVMTMAVLDPLIRQWWAWGRAISLVLSAGTSCLVYLVARRILTRPYALIAGLICASSPIMLATGTRILPDVYVMFFTFLAVYLLSARTTTPFAALAGIAFGIAIAYKYPSVLILPACCLVAGRRRWPVFVGATIVTAAALFAPFLPELHQLYEDTVVFQSSRYQYPLGIRILSVLLYGVLLQPLAIFGIWTKPTRWWLIAGYASGIVYIGTSQVYYHYMLPIVPFGAILGATYLASLRAIDLKKLIPAAAIAALSITVVWAVILEYTPGFTPFRITSAQTANLTPVIDFILRHTSSTEQILDDRPDLPVLSYRQNCGFYFWSDAQVETAQQLWPCLYKRHYIIHFYSGGDGYPVALLDGTFGIDARWCKHVKGSGPDGAYVYDHTCVSPYIPPRN
jgi:hypothetical protein